MLGINLRPFVAAFALASLLYCCMSPADAQFGRRWFGNQSQCVNGNCGQEMSEFTLVPSTASFASQRSTPVATSLSSEASVTADGYVVRPEDGKVITELYGIPIVTRSYMTSRMAEATVPDRPLIGSATTCECTCDCEQQLAIMTQAIATNTSEVRALKETIAQLTERVPYGEKPAEEVEAEPEATSQLDPMDAMIQERVAMQRAARAAAMDWNHDGAVLAANAPPRR